MSRRCPSCQRRVNGDPRFCPCVDERILGLRPSAPPSQPPSALLQGLIIIALQIAFVLLFRPLLGS